MTITADRKKEVIETYRTSESDSGSAQVQIALLTERITNLTEHMKSNRQDFSSRRGLLKLVSTRNRLLRYLQRTDRPAYLELIGKLGLRK